MEQIKQDIISALKAVIERQRLLMANLMGNLFLAFVLYSFYSYKSLLDPSWNSIAGIVAVCFCATWLNASTMAAFHPGVKVTPFVPVLRRLGRVLPWAGAVLATLLLFRWMSAVLGGWVWAVGIAAVLAILPMLSQAAGDGFSRQKAIDLVFNERYWMSCAGLLVVGLYLPVAVFSWIPLPESLVLRLLTGSIRMGLAGSLLLTAWMTLAALIAQLGSGENSLDPTSARVLEGGRTVSDPDGAIGRVPAGGSAERN